MRAACMDTVMDPITNVDRLVLLLRQRLLERSRSPTARRGAVARRTSAQPATRSEGVQALARIDGVDDRQLGRALIQGLLSDQFGGALINDAKFQQLVDRVTEAMTEDAGTSKLLHRIVNDLRAEARP